MRAGFTIGTLAVLLAACHAAPVQGQTRGTYKFSSGGLNGNYSAQLDPTTVGRVQNQTPRKLAPAPPPPPFEGGTTGKATMAMPGQTFPAPNQVLTMPPGTQIFSPGSTWPGGRATLSGPPSFPQATAKPKTPKRTARAKASDVEDLKKRLEKLEKELEKEIDKLKDKNKPKKRVEEVECQEDKVYYTVPLVGERLQEAGFMEPNTKPFMRRWGADYNKGFLISPLDKDRDKFQLKVNGWIQFRHKAFVRNVTNWTDNAGVTREVRNRNNFDVERGRITFGGHAIDPRLTYFLQLDGDTDGREAVDFFDYWWAWKFSDALRIQVGKRKVASSRRWLMGARDSRFSDRPIATDFFRPDRTTGIWATGKFDDVLFYEANVGNGYRTAARNESEIDDKLSFAGTVWWDAAGPFGKSLTDHALSQETLLRIGASVAYAPQIGSSLGNPLRESGFLRLADGTVLTQTGALAPGVTVSKTDVSFAALDFGWKDNGWSLSAEAYFRWLNNLAGDGVLPQTEIFQHGFFVELGSVIAKDFSDWNVRYSEINGDFGRGTESGIGFNVYPLRNTGLKVSFDVSYYDGSPLNNTSSDVLAGDSGVLFRTQIQAQF